MMIQAAGRSRGRGENHGLVRNASSSGYDLVAVPSSWPGRPGCGARALRALSSPDSRGSPQRFGITLGLAVDIGRRTVAVVRRAGHLATSLGSGASAWPGVRRRPGVDAPAGTASRATGVVIIVTVCVSARRPDAGHEATARWCGRGRGGCSGPAVSAVVTPAGGHGGEATPSGTIRATFGDPPGAPPGRRPVRDQSARCRCRLVSRKSWARFSVVSRRSALPCLAGSRERHRAGRRLQSETPGTCRAASRRKGFTAPGGIGGS